MEFDLTPLALLKARGVDLHTIIDGGAAWGNWTREVQQVYPKATYLCIEPRLECKNALEALQGHVIVETALIGDCEREVEFHVHDLQSSIYRNTRNEHYGALALQRMTTLDAIVADHNLYPNYLKLDLQGGELEAIKGAQCLIEENHPIIQLELNLMRFYTGIPIAHEVIGYMASIGYVIFDFTDPLRRTLDQALGNIDAIFIPEDSELRANPRWGWGNFS